VDLRQVRQILNCLSAASWMTFGGLRKSSQKLREAYDSRGLIHMGVGGPPSSFSIAAAFRGAPESRAPWTALSSDS
jgi:hypothetical protein